IKFDGVNRVITSNAHSVLIGAHSMNLKRRELKYLRRRAPTLRREADHIKKVRTNRRRSHAELIRQVVRSQAVISVAVGKGNARSQKAGHEYDCANQRWAFVSPSGPIVHRFTPTFCRSSVKANKRDCE